MSSTTWSLMSFCVANKRQGVLLFFFSFVLNWVCSDKPYSFLKYWLFSALASRKNEGSRREEKQHWVQRESSQDMSMMKRSNKGFDKKDDPQKQFTCIPALWLKIHMDTIWIKKKKKTTHAWVDNMDQGAFTELVRKMELMKMRESQLWKHNGRYMICQAEGKTVYLALLKKQIQQ